jgi:hypothetical protein
VEVCLECQLPDGRPAAVEPKNSCSNVVDTLGAVGQQPATAMGTAGEREAIWPVGVFILHALSSAHDKALGKVFNFFLKKIDLPSAGDLVLGKAFYFFKKNLCRELAIWHSAKNFQHFFKFLCRVPTILHSVKNFRDFFSFLCRVPGI